MPKSLSPPRVPRPASPAPRAGVSLLEVLIAMFVITIGLLGVAALIPTGHFAVVKSTEADRAAACGRAALSEVATREMLVPTTWRWPTGNYAGPGAALYAAQYGDAFAIDPLFIAQNVVAVAPNYSRLAAFPYDSDYNPPGTPPPTWGPYFLHRITYADVSGTMTPAVLPPSIANRIFTFGDDLIFETERTEPDQRARASVLWNTGRVGPYPDPTAATTDFPLLQQNAGHYTWLLTVSPAATEIGGTSFRKYTVSAVVSHRRDTVYLPIDPSNPPDAENMPPERLATVVSFDGGGYGGGDVTLGIPTGVANAGNNFDAAQREAYLKVKPGNWIMLLGVKYDARISPPRADLGNQQARRVANWYRVVSVDDEVVQESGNWIRRVTLDGPDWEPSDALIPPPFNQSHAVLMDDVIGVYTKTIEVGE
ncbi:MAG: hypothetical protein GX621_07915 [Pirellulaceae bacterium]|nr:hypothetical protein [Pirellulaceae bacterium]